MATNAEDNADNDSEIVTEDDLRDLKYPKDDVETSDEEDETSDGDEDEEELEDASDEDDQSDDSQEEDDDSDEEEPPQFVKKFDNIKGDTPEEYVKYLEEAYENSTSEAMRLKALATNAPPKKEDASADDLSENPPVNDPALAYAKQKMDDEMVEAYTKFSKRYKQVDDPVEYDKFTKNVQIIAQTVYANEGRYMPFDQLYNTAANILGWEPENAPPSPKDKLKVALKNNAATSKTTSGASGKPKPKSKVTDKMIEASRRMYPDKTDAEIRAELEPYVN